MAGLLTFACIGASIVLLLVAALHDAATRTIPNAIPAGLVAVGILLHLLEGQLLIAVVASSTLLLLLGLLWIRGFIGGGDAKLMPAASLVLPAASVPSYVLAVAMAGGVLALAYWILSVVTPRPRAGVRTGLLSRLIKAELWRLNRRGPLPYAVAISAGALLVLGKSFSG